MTIAQPVPEYGDCIMFAQASGLAHFLCIAFDRSLQYLLANRLVEVFPSTVEGLCATLLVMGRRNPIGRCVGFVAKFSYKIRSNLVA